MTHGSNSHNKPVYIARQRSPLWRFVMAGQKIINGSRAQLALQAKQPIYRWDEVGRGKPRNRLADLQFSVTPAERRRSDQHRDIQCVARSIFRQCFFTCWRCSTTLSWYSSAHRHMSSCIAFAADVISPRGHCITGRRISRRHSNRVTENRGDDDGRVKNSSKRQHGAILCWHRNRREQARRCG